VGAQKDKRLGLEGEDLQGMIPGLRLLRDINGGKEVHLGPSVLIIGGGNVAVDVARSAVRLGCKEVTICYRREERDMPAYSEEIEEAKKEGVRFHFLASPEKVLAERGRALGIRFRLMRMGGFNNEGRRVPEATGETLDVHADHIVTAIGQDMDPAFAGPEAEGLLDKGGYIKADGETMATGTVKVYAGGDAVNGPASVIEAIAQGKRAARSIDVRLSGCDRMDRLDPRISYSMTEPADNQERMDRREPAHLETAARRGFEEVVSCMDDGSARHEARRCFRCDLSAEGDE
jgi:NADH-quinone oxidoreductase subunit F